MRISKWEQGFGGDSDLLRVSLHVNRLKCARMIKRCVGLFLALSIFVFSVQAKSQVAGAGSIQGTVTDPAGALIPNASVKLVESSTQVTLTTKTTSGGDYAFPHRNCTRI
jgi:Carboxypeptidase regulatory-like domain